MRHFLMVGLVVIAAALLFLTWRGVLMEGSTSGYAEPTGVSQEQQSHPAPPDLIQADDLNPQGRGTEADSSRLEPEFTRTPRASDPHGDQQNADTTSEDATLNVQVVSSEAGEPLHGIELLLFPIDGLGPNSASSIRGHIARLGQSPSTNQSGEAEFRVPSSRPFRLTAQSEDVLIGVARLDVAPLHRG